MNDNSFESFVQCAGSCYQQSHSSFHLQVRLQFKLLLSGDKSRGYCAVTADAQVMPKGCLAAA